MKLILALFALAITSEASYSLPKLVIPSVTYGLPEEPKPVVPAVVYGVPEEPKPVVPAVVYGVPEESKHEITPVKTEYSYTIPAVQTHHEVIAPVSPVVAVHPESSEIHVPSGVTTLVDGYTLPHASVAYSPEYISPAAHFYNPHLIPSPIAGYSGYYGYYGYSLPHASYPHVVYSGTPLVPSLPSSQVVTITGPSHISSVITGSHELSEDNHEELEVISKEPIVSKYEYEIPQVVKPIVPHTTYGLPHIVVPEVPKPIVPHTTYGLPY